MTVTINSRLLTSRNGSLSPIRLREQLRFDHCVAAILVLASVLSFGHALRHGDHNEQMYVAAGKLVAEGELIYRDFGFVQMPYLPFVYAGIFSLPLQCDQMLLARLFNWAMWYMGAFVVYAIARKVGHDRLLGLTLMVFYIVSPIMLRITHEASNYALPATLSLVQFLLLARDPLGPPLRHPLLRSTLIGMLGGLAVGIKLYYLPVVLPCLFLAGFAGRPTQSLAALTLGAAGFAFALLPAAVLWCSMPTSFLFFNLEFHGLTTNAYRAVGTTAPISILQKMNYIRERLLADSGGGFTTLFLCWGTYWMVRRGCGLSRGLVYSFAAVLCSITLGLSVVVFMTPCWPQYLALVMPYVFVAAILALCYLPTDLAETRALLMTVAAFVSFLAFLNPKDAAALLSPQRLWQPLVSRTQAAGIHDAVSQASVSGKLATLQPIFAIQAGMPFYSEFSAGPFVFAVADGLPEEKQKQFVSVGRDRLTRVLDADPPAAILAGFYAGDRMFDDSCLIAYAEQRGYRRTTLASFPKQVFFVRSAAVASDLKEAQ